MQLDGNPRIVILSVLERASSIGYIVPVVTSKMA